MKHLSYLMLALLLYAAGVLPTRADKVYDVVGFGETPLEEITVGEPTALYFTRDKTGFLDSENFTTLSNLVTESCLFVFEEAGAESLYYIKALKSGKYLYFNSSYDLALTESRLNAEAFLIVHPDYYNSTTDVPEDADPRFISVDPNTFPGCGWLLNIDGWSTQTQAYYLSCYSGQNYSASSYTNYTGKYYYYNTWLFYDVVESGGYDKLQQVFASLFPDGTLGTYKAGTQPGCIPQDVYDELKAAFEDAQRLLDEMSTDSEACSAAADRLQNAADAAAESIIKLGEGYYFITNYAAPYKAMTVTESHDKVVFNTDDPTLSFDNELTYEDIPYLWKLHAKSENSSSFYIQHVATGLYMGNADYYKTPTTIEPEKTWDIQNSNHFEDAYTIVLTGSGYGASARGSSFDPNVVLYYYDGPSYDYSAWKLVYVPEEAISGLEESIAQGLRTTALRELAMEALSTFRDNIGFTSEATADNKYPSPADGLVTSVDQVSTNAQEPSYGPLSNILDGKSTYFQSNFSNAMTALHYIDFDLRKEVRNVTMKLTRISNHYPTHVEIFASKDGTDWVSHGEYDIAYTTEKDSTALLSLALFGDYSHLRFQVMATSSNATYNGNLYFRLAEARIYEAQQVLGDFDKEVANNLLTKLLESQKIIEANTATEEDINSLRTALDRFKAYIPDHEGLAQLISKYEASLAVATEGEEVGDYAVGSIAAFQSVINGVKASEAGNELKTASQIEAAKQTLTTAYEAFCGSLVGPEGIFFIKDPTGQYLYVTNSSRVASIRSGGYSEETGDDTNLPGRLNYMWNCKKAADGTFLFQNVATGHYMQLSPTSSTKLRFTADSEQPETGVRLEGAGEQAFYIGQGDYRLGTVSNYTSLYQGYADKYTFSKLEDGAWTETYFEDVAPGEAFIRTLPFDVLAVIGANTYELKGFTHDGANGTLEFKELPFNETIPAGMPFLCVPEEAATSVNYLPAFNDLTDITYKYEELNRGGMFGVLESVRTTTGMGFLHKGAFVTATNDDSVIANTGYFVLSEMRECAKGDFSLPLDAQFLVGVSDPVLSTKAASSTAYDLQGRRVQQMNHGIYIVGGQKVIR